LIVAFATTLSFIYFVTNNNNNQSNLNLK